MRVSWRRFLVGLALVLGAQTAAPVAAATGGDINGGGMTDTMTRFALAIHAGQGHFECLMPHLMTVEATVTSVSVTGDSATFSGVATVTIAAPFGKPAGPMAVGAPFTASVVAGGPGVGKVDLKILGMDFPGTVEHGQISVGS